MKALRLKSYGGSEVLEIDEVEKPILKPGQVLVEVYAAAINPFDVKVSRGFYAQSLPVNFPATLGGDFAGIIREIGEGASGFADGDEVYGSANVFGGGSGSFAEFVAANSKNIAKKPDIDFIKAGSLPLVGSSCVQALEEHIQLKSGQKILIHGGAGGIGSTAIQLAKAIGAYVATTVSSNDVDFVKPLGADEIIDYKTQKFEEILKDFDAVYDTVGGETTNKSFLILKKGGILVSMIGQPNEESARKYGVTAVGQGTKTNSEHLQRLAELVNNGKIKAQVDKIFPLEQIKEAFTYQEDVHPRGKVVLQIKKNP